jgi:hypothetical protein
MTAGRQVCKVRYRTRTGLRSLLPLGRPKTVIRVSDNLVSRLQPHDNIGKELVAAQRYHVCDVSKPCPAWPQSQWCIIVDLALSLMLLYRVLRITIRYRSRPLAVRLRPCPSLIPADHYLLSKQAELTPTKRKYTYHTLLGLAWLGYLQAPRLTIGSMPNRSIQSGDDIFIMASSCFRG